VKEISFLKILDHTKLDTHTHTHKHTHTHTHTYTHTHTHTPYRTPVTSYQLVAHTATYTTHYKHNRQISTPSAGLEPAIVEIKELQPTP